MSAYPIAYLPWQLRDVLRGPGLVTALIAGFFGLLVWKLPGQFVGAGGVAVFQGYLTYLGWPLVLIATGEMVRTDRAEGYYRFYFSRPVHPSAFYFVRFLLGFALVLGAISLIASAIWYRSGVLALPSQSVGRLALLYLVLGGTVFLLSTLFTGGPRDWLAALIIQAYQNTVADLIDRGLSIWPGFAAAHLLLPPIHLARPGVEPMTPAAVIHTSLYGVALVGAALAVLHFRPLGSGARD